VILFSDSPEETFALGKKMGENITGPRTVCFFGDLAAGKTTFIKGFVSGAASISPDEVSSPTFVLLNIYEGEQSIYHFDLYRLQNAEGFFSLGFEEYWNAPGICCIEWAERIEEVLPKNAIYVRMKSLSENKREILLEGIDDLEKI
jgi:tRNA threonylcarbamoyladenosine biosynthesis protein TsaE